MVTQAASAKASTRALCSTVEVEEAFQMQDDARLVGRFKRQGGQQDIGQAKQNTCFTVPSLNIRISISRGTASR